MGEPKGRKYRWIPGDYIANLEEMVAGQKNGLEEFETFEQACDVYIKNSPQCLKSDVWDIQLFSRMIDPDVSVLSQICGDTFDAFLQDLHEYVQEVIDEAKTRIQNDFN